MKTSVRRGVASLIVAVGLVVTAACSSSGTKASTASNTTTAAGASAGSGSGSGSGSGDSAAAAAAKARVDPYLQPSTSIGITTPLSAKPPSGKKVYWLEGNIQSIIPITSGFKEAAAALGWNLTVLSYDAADPQAPSSAMRQAVNAGADYIAVSGQTVSTLGQGLEAAKAKHIPVFDMYSTDPVQGASNGIYANIGGPAFSQKSEALLSDFIIADSGGKANVLFVNIPDFAILQVVANAVNTEFKSSCATCKVTPLNVSVTDLTSGAVGSQVVSSLQSNTNLGYVLLSIGDLATGLPQSLATANVAGRAKIVGGVPNREEVQSLIDNKAAAYIPLGRPESGWATMDAIARYAEGMDVAQAEHELLPIEIWTPQNVPKPATDFAGPAGYQAQFKQLWKV
jgi:ribose transport system substrate-binding protein